MPTKTNTPGREPSAADKKISGQSRDAAADLTAQRFAATGQTTRVQGHISAQNKRSQGKRDSH